MTATDHAFSSGVPRDICSVCGEHAGAHADGLETLARRRAALVVKPKGLVEVEVNQGPLEPGKHLAIWYAPEGVFHLQDVSLYDHENGRVDVKVRLFGAEIKWSSLYHVGAVKIDRTLQPTDSLTATLRNVSDETVFARVRLRGFWK